MPMKMLLIGLIAALIGLFALGNHAPAALTGRTSSREPVIVPVTARLVTDASGYYTTTRDAQDAQQVLAKTNRIWEQAGISFQLESIVPVSLSFGAIPDALNGNAQELQENSDPRRVTIFFVQSLNNINGFTIPESRAILVADDSNVHDYRTAAHELGHLLGLPHVSGQDRLMAQGRNGELLTPEEVAAALAAAAALLRGLAP